MGPAADRREIIAPVIGRTRRMADDAYENIKIEKEDGITWLILDRPEKRNGGVDRRKRYLVAGGPAFNGRRYAISSDIGACSQRLCLNAISGISRTHRPVFSQGM